MISTGNKAPCSSKAGDCGDSSTTSGKAPPPAKKPDTPAPDKQKDAVRADKSTTTTRSPAAFPKDGKDSPTPAQIKATQISQSVENELLSKLSKTPISLNAEAIAGRVIQNSSSSTKPKGYDIKEPEPIPSMVFPKAPQTSSPSSSKTAAPTSHIFPKQGFASVDISDKKAGTAGAKNESSASGKPKPPTFSSVKAQSSRIVSDTATIPRTSTTGTTPITNTVVSSTQGTSTSANPSESKGAGQGQAEKTQAVKPALETTTIFMKREVELQKSLSHQNTPKVDSNKSSENFQKKTPLEFTGQTTYPSSSSLSSASARTGISKDSAGSPKSWPIDDAESFQKKSSLEFKGQTASSSSKSTSPSLTSASASTSSTSKTSAAASPKPWSIDNTEGLSKKASLEYGRQGQTTSSSSKSTSPSLASASPSASKDSAAASSKAQSNDNASGAYYYI